MRQRRRFAAMLAALALAAGLTAIPALATEGGSPSTYTPGPGGVRRAPQQPRAPQLLFPEAHGPAQLLLFARALAERSVGQ